MVVNARPIRFEENSPIALYRHLDEWARYQLGSPEAWASALERCSQWLDYSPRNQVLLASYGVAGPVAGPATWERVPSVEPGRNCAIRAGEHALLVRVPVVGEADVASDRSRLGGQSGSVAGSHRWEGVFASEQLARRPALGALQTAAVPELTAAGWNEVLRGATGRLLGRTPRQVSDPVSHLTMLASKVPRGANRDRLPEALAAQAGWLVADRVGRAEGSLPMFEPARLMSRDRWQTAVDVRRSVAIVLDAVSGALGVELSRSPLPRHELVDDGHVPAGRRNYLSSAEVRSLPLGVWIESGPYKRTEWLARGIAGAAGVGAFMRVNDRSYLAVYETKGGAIWRLETTGRGAHRGLVGEGQSDNLATAKRDVAAALAERFPDASLALEAVHLTRVGSSQFGWSPAPGGRDERTQQRVFDEHVTAFAAPGPGGRWQSWITVDSAHRDGPLSADADTARTVADGLARGAMMELAAVTPQRANDMAHVLATSDGEWDRADLVALIGNRLTDADASELAVTSDLTRLSELMRNAGVLEVDTMLHVLHAEGADLATVLPIAATSGLPASDAIRVLHDCWNADRLEVGQALGATVDELRRAGCSAVEMLQAAPREALRHLDQREHTWEVIAPSLLEAGYSVAEAVGHLAAHAPTPDTFAVGVATIVSAPIEAFALAGRCAAVDDLVALSECYGLDHIETAGVVAAGCVPADKAVAVIAARSDGDPELTPQLAARFLGLDEGHTAALLRGDAVSEVARDPASTSRDLDLGVERAVIGRSGIEIG